MLSGLFDSARAYFYLPVDDEDNFLPDDNSLPSDSKYIAWQSSDSLGDLSESSDRSSPFSSSRTSLSSPSATRPPSPKSKQTLPRPPRSQSILEEILSETDLYKVLGIQRYSGDPDKHALRRAYLSRSKACHPDKFPNNTSATRAFQKVSVAYDVLSDISTKKIYDSKSPAQRQQFDFFASRPRAEETLRSVLLGVFNDFLEGDLEIVRTFLRALNDLNPNLRLGEDGIDSVLLTLNSIREQALTCRTCIIALHSELSQLLELQAAFRKLSYFDILSRSRLTLQIAKVTVGLPLKVEEALVSDWRYRMDHPPDRDDKETTVVLPRKIFLVIRGVVVVLERMESVLS